MTRSGAGRSRNLHVVLVVTAMAIAAVLHFPGLFRGIWRDEASTWLFAGLPLSQVWGAVWWVDANPPLFYFLEWIERHLFGDSIVGLKMVSYISSVLLPYAVYRVAVACDCAKAGCIAALIVACNWSVVDDATNARGYMLSVIMTTIFAYWVLSSNRRPRRFHILGLGCLLAVVWYIQYGGIPATLCVMLASIVWLPDRRTRVIDFVSAFGLAAILYLPWAGALLLHSKLGYPQLTNPTGMSLITNAATSFGDATGLRNATDVPGIPLVFCSLLGSMWILAIRFTQFGRIDRNIGFFVTTAFLYAVITASRGAVGFHFEITVVGFIVLAIALISTRVFELATVKRSRYSLLAFIGVLVPFAIIGCWMTEQRVIRSFLPISGVGVFWNAVHPDSHALVIADPDNLAATLGYYDRGAGGLNLDSFMFPQCPEWQRFAGYTHLWSDRTANTERIASLLREASGREVYLVVASSLADVGRIDFSHGNAVVEAFRHREHPDFIRSYERMVSPVEPVVVYHFKPHGHVISDLPYECQTINGFSASYARAQGAL